MKVKPGARKRRIPAVVLTVIALTWGVCAAVAASAKLDNLSSSWSYDLAFFHNLLWSTIHGSWFAQTSSPHEASGLFELHHTYPILVALVPLYAAVPKVTTLLWVQTLATASAAFPVARLARAGGASPWAAVGIATAFLLQTPLLMTALCDFRPIVLGIPLLLWTVAMVFEDRPLAALLLGAATLTVREEMIYLVIALSVGLPFVRRAGSSRRLMGGVLCGLAVAYWLAVRAAGGELTYYFDPQDASPTGSIALQAPEIGELRFLLPYLLPFGLASLLAVPLLLPALPVLAYLLAGSPHEWADWAGVYGHHAAPLLGVVGAAAAVGWGALTRRVRRWQRPWLIGGLVTVQLGLAAWLAPPLLRADVGPRPGRTVGDEEALRGLLAGIPNEAAVACDYHTMGWLSGRERQVCTADFTMTEGERFPWSPDWYPPGFEDVDWVVFDEVEDPDLAVAAAECGAFERLDRAGTASLYRRTGPGGQECTDALRAAAVQGAVGEQTAPNSGGQ
jgi:hypothetical protein